MPRRASGRGLRARRAAHEVVKRFGYLQLDSIPITGARTHGLVPASRLDGFEGPFADELLQPGEPLFEYWGHEASWLPMELYPVFAFRRQEFAVHPWWGDLLGQHPKVADAILNRFLTEGPLRSKDFEGCPVSIGATANRIKRATRLLGLSRDQDRDSIQLIRKERIDKGLPNTE